jgi:hypothetical protein
MACLHLHQSRIGGSGDGERGGSNPGGADEVEAALRDAARCLEAALQVLRWPTGARRNPWLLRLNREWAH